MIPKSMSSTPIGDGNRFSDKIMRAEKFAPDFKSARVVPSPNHNARTRAIDMIVLHYTAQTGPDALARLCDAAAKVSSHYLVYEDGGIEQLVPEARRAWHAGVSSWDGERDNNSRSIGIEIVNLGHDHGYPDFPSAQIDAVIALGRDIIARDRIRAERVLAHSDIAPARKIDPGEKFPWERLAAAGVGLWVAPAPIAQGSTLAPGDRGEEVEQLQMMLARYGYGVAISRRFDAMTKDAVAAFQRHFRPARIDGIADAATVDTLRRLLRHVQSVR
jgi:N-acetylmuramoyl-L-alanine amidase